MRIYPAPHYTMGGLWVDYNLMSTVPGLFVLGEANFSDHGANRLGASALMQGLADGYFVAPLTMGDWLARANPQPIRTDHAAFADTEHDVQSATDRLLAVNGSRTVDDFHMELGTLMWDRCGLARSAHGLRDALARIPELRDRFWRDVRVPGSGATFNQSLEKAGRVADFLEFAELMCHDALARDESAGAHYRIEHTTSEGEAKRKRRRFRPCRRVGVQGGGERAGTSPGRTSSSSTCRSPRGATSELLPRAVPAPRRGRVLVPFGGRSHRAVDSGTLVDL